MALRLPRLDQSTSYFDAAGKPTLQMQIFWQRTAEAIEEANADILTALDNAGIALMTAKARMPDIPPITVNADHAGVVQGGQLPRSVAFKRYSGTVEQTSTATWSMVVKTGSTTATIGAATGVLNITALGASSTVEVTSVRDGVTLTSTLLIIKDLADPSSTGTGGGTTASDTSFASISSATMATISDELTVTAGSTGEVNMTAPLTITTAAASPEGEFEIYAIWQWFDGATWIDQGTEVASDPDVTVLYDVETGTYYLNEGNVSAAASKTGLTSGTSYRFRLNARNSSGTRTIYFSGTASAVGS